MKKFLALTLTIFLFVALTSYVSAQTDTLTILHVNDTHSNLSPLGPGMLILPALKEVSQEQHL